MSMKIGEIVDDSILKMSVAWVIWDLSIEHFAHLCDIIKNIMLNPMAQINNDQLILFIHQDNKYKASQYTHANLLDNLIKIDQINISQNIERLAKMNMKQLQDSIKLTIKVINKAIPQIPIDKKPFILSRFNEILNRNLHHKDLDSEKLKKFHQELEFNLNFIKLSHPNLDFFVKSQEDDDVNKKQSPQSTSDTKMDQKQGEKKQKQIKHEFNLTDGNSFEYQRLNKKDTFDEQPDIQKKARTQVQFSNWFDGNVDPEQLKRHKQLLERQHFKGEYWKQKPVPENMARLYLENIMEEDLKSGRKQRPQKQQQLQDGTPHSYDKNQSAWQKVKR